MCCRVNDGVKYDAPAGELVEVEIVVDGEETAEPVGSHPRQGSTQHHHDDEYAREVQALS